MHARYSRNISALSIEENENLKNCRVAVVGCGGLGGYVIEMLGRLGVGHIIAVDGDVFEESNLNRQILSDTGSLGAKKALRAKERMSMVNPLIEVEAVCERINSSNGLQILENTDVVVDALDNIESRFLLQEICEELNIPLIHGAIGGWYGQVTAVFPGDKTLNRLYGGRSQKGIEKMLGNPSFTPALVASIEAAEAVKVMIKRGEPLRKKLLVIDLLEQEYEVIDLE